MDDRVDNQADNQADNPADVNEKKFHQLHLFKRKKKDANNKKMQNEKRRIITFFFTKVKILNGRRVMRSPYMMAILKSGILQFFASHKPSLRIIREIYY